MANTKKLLLNRGDDLPPFLRDLFYGNEGTDTRMCLRSTEVTGLTRSCYVAEKLFIVRYVLQKYYEFDFNLHSRFESIVNAITGQYNSFTSTQYFSDQKGEKLVPYITRKMEDLMEDLIKESKVNSSEARVSVRERDREADTILHFGDRLRFLTALFSSQFNSRTELLTAARANHFLTESNNYPIAMAFGYNKDFSNVIYEIDHWFVLYHGRIYGATGLGAVQISFFGSKEITLPEFATFLNTMNEYNEDEDKASKMQKKEIFNKFIIENMLPEEYHVPSFKQKLYGSKDEGETRDSHILTDFPTERGMLLDSYKDLNKYCFYVLNGYGNDESYIETIKKAIDCLSKLPMMKNEIEVTKPPKRDKELTEEEMFNKELSTLLPKKVKSSKRTKFKTPHNPSPPLRKSRNSKQPVISSSSSSSSGSRTPLKERKFRLGKTSKDVEVGGGSKKKRTYKHNSKYKTRKYKTRKYKTRKYKTRKYKKN